MRRRFLQTSLAAALSLLFLAGAGFASTVRVAVPEYSARTKPYFSEAEHAFEAANPGIDIRVDIVPREELRRRLTTEMGEGGNPDLAIISGRWLVDFVRLDALEPLDGLITGDLKSRLIAPFLAAAAVDGKTYGLPFTASVRALYYNRDLFAKTGIAEAPKTWDELKTAAEKIAGLGGGRYGYGLAGKGVEADVFFYYVMWGQGVEVIDENGRSGLASDGAIAAAKFYKELIDKGATQPAVTAFPREGVENLFKEGKLGMVIADPLLAREIRQQGRGVDYGVATVPAGPTGARGTYGEADLAVMFKTSKAKEDAWKFLDYLFTADLRARFTLDEGFLPVTMEEAKAEHYANDADLKPFVDLLPLARFTPPIAGWEIVAQRTTEALEKVYLGGDIEATLKAVAEEINRILLK
ncbi:MAG: sugar ABC transporter substrate-binding protein [Parvibaculaceae bacterium]